MQENQQITSPSSFHTVNILITAVNSSCMCILGFQRVSLCSSVYHISWFLTSVILQSGPTESAT